jgi:hypothetical protein
MRVGMCGVAVLIGAMGIVSDVAAAENNSSLAPLILSTATPDNTTLANVKNGADVYTALFGSGARNNTQLIQNVWIGDKATATQALDANPYTAINDVLQGLGFTGAYGLNHGQQNGHESHFHVDLRAPILKPVIDTHNLLADGVTSNQNASSPSYTIIASAQSWLNQVKADMGLAQGEVNMFIPDMPNVPPQNVPVMIAQVNQTQPGDTVAIRTLGVCAPVPNDPANYSLENVIAPKMEAAFYLQEYEGENITYSAPGNITILEQPKHGILRLETETNHFGSGRFDPTNPSYAYLPEQGYLGKDSATVMVDIGGKQVKVKYYFQAVGGGLGSYGIQEYCGKTGYHWKISSILDANGASTITSVEYQSPTIDVGATSTDTAALASTLESSVLSSLSVDPSIVTLNIADLPGGAVGQTVGTTITLDDNAAGNNWFIDTTPADNSEFLPTSNPNEWVAKAGSDAAGKMDMLSVLLHEYGHALGIEHSADSGDYMGTTLTVGVRRLPSATELALMQQLIAQAKGEVTGTDSYASTPTLPLQGGGGLPLDLPISLGGLAFAGLLRPNRYGSLSIDLAASATQYEAAANATFTNLDTATAWQTQGSVDITPSSGSGGVASATLNEVSTSQTRLSQVFMLNDNDRYLSFTLAGSVLDNPTGAPEDAFEVALLDTSTGASVVSGDGLTRTDAFLNLQGDGTQNAADCVTCIYNADGSRTYRVDLTGVAKNIAVNLSFDLLGFGANNSHVTLRDIRTSGLPQLRDETATIAEDNLLTFDPFSQADAQLKPLLASHIVGTPTHGVLVMNADGTFSYTPGLNYFGADSFSYNLSDGSLDSNLATVSLTVTPVNDAPVAADAQATTAEDTPLVIALGAYASDVDSTNITTQIVTGPQHGVLVQNNDGTYSYTPDANYNGVGLLH